MCRYVTLTAIYVTGFKKFCLSHTIRNTDFNHLKYCSYFEKQNRCFHCHDFVAIYSLSIHQLLNG